MWFISLFPHGDLNNVPTRSKFTGITILVGTFGPHNVINTRYTRIHSLTHTDTHTHTHTRMHTHTHTHTHSFSLTHTHTLTHTCALTHANDITSCVCVCVSQGTCWVCPMMTLSSVRSDMAPLKTSVWCLPSWPPSMRPNPGAAAPLPPSQTSSTTETVRNSHAYTWTQAGFISGHCSSKWLNLMLHPQKLPHFVWLE